MTRKNCRTFWRMRDDCRKADPHPHVRLGVTITLIALAQLMLSPPAPAAPADGALVQEDDLPAGAATRIGTLRFKEGVAVSQLLFSPDGKRLLSISGDTAHLRDLPEGKVVARFPASAAWPWATFSPDGRLLATVTNVDPSGERPIGGAITLYDAATAKALHELRGESGTYTACIFSPDGRTLLAGTSKGAVAVIDWAAGTVTASLQLAGETTPPVKSAQPTADAARQWPITGMVYAAEHQTLAVVQASPSGYQYAGMSRVVLWDLAKKAPRFTGAMIPSSCELVLANGKDLTAVFAEQPSQTWDLRAGQTYPPDAPPAVRADASHTKRMAVVPSPSLKRYAVIMMETEHNKPPTTTFFLPDESRVGFKLFDAVSFKGVAAFSPDGQMVAAAASDGMIRLFGAADRKLINAPAAADEPVRALAIAADGKRVATAGDSGVIRIRPLGGAGDAAQLDAWDFTFDDSPGKRIVALGFAPDGASLVAASADGLIRRWRLADKSLTDELKSTDYGLPVESNIAFTRDGRYFAVACRTGPRVFDAVAFGPEDQPAPDLGREFSRDLHLRSDKSSDGLSPSLLVPRFDRRRLMNFHALACVAIHGESGRWLLSKDDVLTVYDSADDLAGRRLYPTGAIEPARPVKLFRHACFSPDGKLVVAVQDVMGIEFGNRAVRSRNQSIRVWDAATGAQLVSFDGHRGGIRALAFAPDGKLVTGGDDGVVLVWDLSSRPAGKALAGDAALLLKALTGADSEEANAAMARAAEEPALALRVADAYFNQPAADPLLAKLFADLASDQFVVRFAALRTLANWRGQRGTIPAVPGPKVLAQLDGHLLRFIANPATPGEAAQRVHLPVGTANEGYSPAKRDLLRVVKMLEWTGGDEAGKLIAHIGARLPGTAAASACDAALQRIKAGDHRADLPGKAVALAAPPPQNPQAAPNPPKPPLDPPLDPPQPATPAAPRPPVVVKPPLPDAPRPGPAAPADPPRPLTPIAPKPPDAAKPADLPKPIPTPPQPPKPLTPGGTNPVPPTAISPAATISDLDYLKGPGAKAALPAGVAARFGGAGLRHGARVEAVAFFADGQRLASAAKDGTVRVWDLRTGAEIKRLTDLPQPTAVAVSADGRWLACSGVKPGEFLQVKVYDTSTWKMVHEWNVNDCAGLLFSPDSSTLVAAGSLQTAVFDLAAGKQRFTLPQSLDRGQRTLFSPDSQSLLSFTVPPRPAGNADRKLIAQLRVWDLTKEALKFESPPLSSPDESLLGAAVGAAITPDKSSVVSVYSGGATARWSIRQAGPAQAGVSLKGLAPIRRAAISPQHLAMVVEQGELRYTIDPLPGKLLLVDMQRPNQPRLLAEDQAHWSVAFSPDGKLIAAGGGSDNAVALFDARNGARLDDVNTQPVSSLVLSRDATFLAAALKDHSIVVRRSSDGSVVRRLTGPAQLLHATFKPGDDAVLGASYSDGSVRAWEVTTGRIVGTVPAVESRGQMDPYVYPGWDSEGKLIATKWPYAPTWHRRSAIAVSSDRRLAGDGWNIDTAGKPVRADGQPLMQLKPDSAPTLALKPGESAPKPKNAMPGASAFSADNALYAVAATYKPPFNAPTSNTFPAAHAIYLFDLETQREIARIDLPGEAATALAFSPKNGLLYAACADGSILAFKAPPK